MKDQYIRYIRRGLSLCAALMVIGAFAGCSVAAALQNSVEMEPLRLALAMGWAA